MILTKNLTMTYKNGFTAVKSLNLQVSKGDIFGFLGPNGAGKTTTIRMLTGLLKPTKGEAFINHELVETKNQKMKQLIGVVPESHGYYEYMTGYEYLYYFSRLYNQDKTKAKRHILYLLDKVGLYEKRHENIGHYSRGMRQRLGIAKSLINHPKIIFLDEPTLGLDPIGQKDIQNLIKDINKTLNVTVFITSHLLKDIEVLCNKVCIVQNGVLIEQGSLNDLQDKYSPKQTLVLKTESNKEAYRKIKDNPYNMHLELLEDRVEISMDKRVEKEKLNEIKKFVIEKLFIESIDIHEINKKVLSMEDIFFHVTNKEGK